MVVVRTVWFVVTLPLRAFFWVMWQLQRGASAIVLASQRAFGIRNVIVAFGALLALFGLGHVNGFVECGDGRSLCAPGWETPVGLLLVAVGLILTAIAFLSVPNDRTRVELSPDDLGDRAYRSEDWPLNWSSALTALAIWACIVWVVIMVMTSS